MVWFVRWVVRRRWWVLAGLLVISLLSLWSLRRAVIATSIQRMLLGESAAYASYRERADTFGGDELFVVSYADPEPLSPGSVRRLRHAVDSIAEIPEVGEIQSLLDVLQVTNEGGALEIRPYVERAEASPEDASALTASLEASPAARGLLRSTDRRHSALVVSLRPDSDRSSEVGPQVMDAATTIMSGVGMTALRRGGFVATVAGVLQETRRNLTWLLPITLLTVSASVYFLFRRMLPVVVAVGVALMAVLWTMGFSVQLDPEINVFSAVIPAVILVVAISDTIHLWSAYLLELADGASKEEAIERSAAEVGAACLLTSATTFLGFISLSLIPTPIYRQAGVVLSVGVSVALLITVTLMPALMSLLPAPDPRSSVDPGAGQVGGWPDRLAGFTTRNAAPLAALFAAVTALLIFGATQIHLEADLMSRMAADSDLRQETVFIRQNFAGANQIEVFVDTPAPGGALEPAVLAVLPSIQAEMVAEADALEAAHSLADVLQEIHGRFTGESALPDDGPALAQYMLLLELSDPDAAAPLVDFERKTLRVLGRMSTGEIRKSHDIARRVEALAAAKLPTGVSVEATGLSVLFGGFIDQLVNGQRNGLLFSFGAIAVIMTLGLRSVRWGGASMLPNLLPLLAVAGYVGLAWDPVDSDVALVMMIAIGIGVDDTIHVLVRLRLETARHPMSDAIRRTLRFAGRGIVFTTVILTMGFLPLALSDYFTIRMMGSLLPAALIVALVADILLVPAMASLGVFAPPRASR
ncbi:MAG: MMPL family transporter [Myxococcota bacterium]